jgi:hypothetical protein
MPHNAIAREVNPMTGGQRLRLGAGEFYFVFHSDAPEIQSGMIHGCPCGCGGTTALWFRGQGRGTRNGTRLVAGQPSHSAPRLGFVTTAQAIPRRMVATTGTDICARASLKNVRREKETRTVAATRKQKRRQQWSATLRQWFGPNPGSRELDAQHRHVEQRKRKQCRQWRAQQ